MATPSPGNITSTNAFAASRSFCTFVVPSPASCSMLPERSSTIATDVFGRATVFALNGITHDSAVSSHCTVIDPDAVAPAVVDVYATQRRAYSTGRMPVGGSVTTVPRDVVAHPPVGPAVIRNVSGRQATTSHTAARCVVIPVPPIPSGTSTNEMLGVVRLIDS